MKISPINNLNFESNEKKKNPQWLKNSAIIAGSTTLGAGVGFVKTKTIDIKNFYKNCDNHRDTFIKEIEDSAARAVNQHAIIYPERNRLDLDGTKSILAEMKKEYFEDGLNRLVKEFLMTKKRSLVFSAAAGLVIGVAGVLTATIVRNKKNKNIQQTPITLINPPTQIVQSSPFNKFKSSMSFKGNNNENISINGKIYNKVDVELAKTFLKFKAEKLKLDEYNTIPFDIMLLLAFKKKLTDEEYQEVMAEKKLLTSKPSEPFWGTWSSKWDQYQEDLEKHNEGKRQYKVVCELLKYLRRSEKLEYAQKVEQEFVKNYVIANTKDILINKFIQFINNESENEKPILPNAIMLEGQDKKVSEDIIMWLAQKVNADFKIIQNDEDDDRKCLSKIQTMLEKANTNYNTNGGKRTILYVANFDKLLIPNEENNDVIGDLKDLLGTLEEDYKTTLVFETQNSKALNPIALSPHRVGLKINMNKNLSIDTFNKIKEKFLKANLSNLEDVGIRFQFTPMKDDFVDLYLANYDKCKDILWINSNEEKKISPVLENIKIIKGINKFKDINKIQCPEPSSFENLQGQFDPLNVFTAEKQRIFEKTL